MTHLNATMNTATLTTHRKFTHLSKDERVMTATLKNEGLSNVPLVADWALIVRLSVVQSSNFDAKSKPAEPMSSHIAFIAMKLAIVLISVTIDVLVVTNCINKEFLRLADQ